MLTKAHLTLHSRMSGSGLVITPSWLSGPWRSFLYSSYCAHLCMKCSLGISNFLEEISSLSHSIVFLFLHWSLRKAFLSLLVILWNSVFQWVYLSFSPLPFFLSQLFVRLPQSTILPLCISFSWGGSWSLPPASKFGKLSSGHRSGKDQFSFQSQRKAMPKNSQTTTQLHSSPC